MTSAPPTRPVAAPADHEGARLADLAHELRTPLHALRASLELLQSSGLSPAQTQHITTAHAAAEALLALTSGLLTVQEVRGADGHHDSLGPVAAAPLVASSLLLLGHAASARSITLEPRNIDACGPGSPSCLGDTPRLRQVLINLVSNAIKFSPEHSRVIIRAATCPTRPDAEAPGAPLPGALLFLSVEDAGPGIPASKRTQLYQRESRLGLGKGDPEGHGLGLAISREIITNLGGVLAHTPAAASGSIFWCVVPLASHAAQGRVDAASSHEDLSMFAEALLRSTCEAARSALITRIHTIIDTHATPDTAEASASHTTDSIAPSSQPTSLAPTREPSLAGLSVLVAEDDDVSREVTGRLLEHAGARCTLVHDGETVVRKVTQASDANTLTAVPRFDAVLMDRNFASSDSAQSMDGLAAARAIRVWEACTGARRTPIIAITGDATPQSREACLASGMDAFVTKPFTLADLASAIHAALPGTTPAIDLAQLAARCMHDAAFEARLIDLFLTSLDVRLSGIADALTLGEHDRLRERAHALKGAAANIAAGRLQTLAQQLEDLGSTGELTLASDLMEQLTREARECREMLESTTRAHVHV